MCNPSKQCVAKISDGERCPAEGYAVVKTVDHTASEDDPERVRYFWTCEAHCSSETRLHHSATAMARGTM